MGLPGTALVCPSSLVIWRSAWGVRLSVSVALLLIVLVSVTPFAAVTVAVLDREPVAEDSTVAWTTYVMLLPAGRSTLLSLMFPEPMAVKPVALPVALAVYVIAV